MSIKEDFTPFEIVERLIGPFQPVGAEHIDRERKNSIEFLSTFIDEMLVEMVKASRHKDSYMQSQKDIGVFAHEYLKQMRTWIDEVTQEED